jgi:probable rRNA maturation factor
VNQIDLAIAEPFAGRALQEWLPALAERALTAEGIDGAALSVVITDEATVQALNREYRGYDEPTDVLSFGLTERMKPATDDAPSAEPFPLPPELSEQVGEVVISYPTAVRQAAEHGHHVNDELALLLVHGILHLLGHDHDQPEETRVMHEREAALLREPIWPRPSSSLISFSRSFLAGEGDDPAESDPV